MSDEQKPRKKMIVEEVKLEQPKSVFSDSPKIEVPPQTEPHIEPGIHEEIKQNEEIIPSVEAKSGVNALWIIIPGIFLLGALLGGIVYYQKNISGIKISVTTPSPVPQETTSPSPTPSSKVDIEKYEVKILNGSGISGEAGKAKTLLQKAGFTISATANASSYSYTKSVIQAKSVVEKEFITKLNEALSESYVVDSKTQSLSSSSSEVVVIIGSSKN